jgi:hypothetical protein
MTGKASACMPSGPLERRLCGAIRVPLSHTGGRVVATADDYRKYARECARFALEAQTEAERTTFLEMARAWSEAALRLEPGSTHLGKDRIVPPTSTENSSDRS